MVYQFFYARAVDYICGTYPKKIDEKVSGEKTRSHMVFIDLEKAYDSVPHRLIWDTLEVRVVPRKYIDIIRDMCVRTKTCVRAPVGDTDFFHVEVGLHQGSALSPFLFTIVLDKLSRSIQETGLECEVR
ncbi:putative RNA-directed DNA polymerase [Helianthus annuus]|nr:putative RNA-directed DNA polymerase [Helianthus annuus]